MPQLFDHQITGAEFLAPKAAALLADAPRVGKTGTAIRAADYVFARFILVITTATARAQWGRELAVWGLPRSVFVCYGAASVPPPDAEAVVVGWHEFFKEPLFSALTARFWDVVIPDEAHNACNVLNGEKPTQRTIRLYGKGGITSRAGHVWPLTGTPMPNGNPMNLWPMLRSLAPQRLGAFVESEKFQSRFCVMKTRWQAGRTIETVVRGQNLEELSGMIDGFWLRRSQEDVGIKPPIYSVFAMHVDRKSLAMLGNVDVEAVLDAAETGDTATLEMHLGTIRRVTGTIKAYAVVDAVKEAFANGLDKVVLMSWHTDVIDILREGLSDYGVIGIDGRTPASAREGIVSQWSDSDKRVFNGQMVACGEAIDLSAAAELWFPEASFAPIHMAQAALRITNHAQKRLALVRVCALEGSIDEALMTVLTRKVETIRKVMEQ